MSCGDEAQHRVKPIRIVHHLWLNTCAAEDRHECVVVRRRKTARKEEEAVIAKRRQGDRAAPGKGMTGGEDRDQRLAEDRFHPKHMVAGREPQKSSVDLSVAEHL